LPPARHSLVVGDEVEIRIEPGEPDDGDGGRWAGPGASSKRLARGRNRWQLVIAALVVAGLVAGGLSSLLGDDGRSGDRDGARDREGPDTAIPRVAWTEVTLGLSEAGSFAYRGTVHASEAGPMRPGAWIAEDVSVEGAVLLSDAITREKAVAPGGEAVETVTSGATVWTRTAPTAARLADRPWERVSGPGPEPLGWHRSSLPARMGLALVLDVLAPTVNRHSSPPDGAGRRTLYATVPDRSPARIDLVRGADVVLTLGDDGVIERIGVADVPADGPELVMDLAIDHVGEPGLVTPADVGEPARRTVKMDALDAARVEAVELGRLPDGWGLTGALAAPDGDTEGLDPCAQLRLEYRDLAPDDDGWLALSIASDGCRVQRGTRGAWPARLRAGAFAGSALEGTQVTTGSVSDGVTSVGFVTNLSAADAAEVLVSLAPFDPSA
jgi:hypothetical protein